MGLEGSCLEAEPMEFADVPSSQLGNKWSDRRWPLLRPWSSREVTCGRGLAPVGQSPANLTQVTSCRGCLVFFGPYAWANFTILAVGVWAVAQRDSIDAISMVSWESSVGRFRESLLC